MRILIVLLLSASAIAQCDPKPVSNAPDVPAIKADKCRPYGVVTVYGGAHGSVWSYPDNDTKICYSEDTCADKSRILMTAEDGTKWCHKPDTKEPGAIIYGTIAPATSISTAPYIVGK